MGVQKPFLNTSVRNWELLLRAPAHVLPSSPELEEEGGRASKEFQSLENEKLIPQFTEYSLCTKFYASQLIPCLIKSHISVKYCYLSFYSKDTYEEFNEYMVRKVAEPRLTPGSA